MDLFKREKEYCGTRNAGKKYFEGFFSVLNFLTSTFLSSAELDAKRWSVSESSSSSEPIFSRNFLMVFIGENKMFIIFLHQILAEKYAI